jgi:hypothetical protein
MPMPPRVRRCVPAAVFLAGSLFGGAASGQEPQRVHLELTVEQVMLAAGVLSNLGCQTVEQLQRCQQAVELLKEIREQVKAQSK